MSIFTFLGSLAELLAPCRRRRVPEPEEENTSPEQHGHNELGRHWLSRHWLCGSWCKLVALVEKL